MCMKLIQRTRSIKSQLRPQKQNSKKKVFRLKISFSVSDDMNIFHKSSNLNWFISPSDSKQHNNSHKWCRIVQICINLRKNPAETNYFVKKIRMWEFKNYFIFILKRWKCPFKDSQSQTSSFVHSLAVSSQLPLTFRAVVLFLFLLFHFMHHYLL